MRTSEKSEKQPLTAAVLMAKARWKGVTAKERSALMKRARQAPGSGRPRAKERCYCGQNSLHRATLRAFDCCKRAGRYPTGKPKPQAKPVRGKGGRS